MKTFFYVLYLFFTLQKATAGAARLWMPDTGRPQLCFESLCYKRWQCWGLPLGQAGVFQWAKRTGAGNWNEGRNEGRRPHIWTERQA